MTNQQGDYQVTTNEIMDFLKENMATKGDLDDLRQELRQDIKSM